MPAEDRAPHALTPSGGGLQPRWAIAGMAVAAAYVLSAQLGFRVAFVAEQVTTVWPPSGIAIAALVLWGPRLWPAIWAGAFVANAMTSAPIWTAAPIASGNTLEAFGAMALLRLTKFDAALGRLWDAIAFLVIAAVASPMIAATIGVTTLCAAGVQPWASYSAVWTDWVLGDAVGALIVAPALLTSWRASFRFRRRQILETAALVASTLVVTAITFGSMLTRSVGAHPLEFVIFPFVITAAVRLRQPATSIVILAASTISIWNTVHGSGPFASGSVHQGLVLLQVFMGVLASSGLVLAAATTERARAERALRESEERTRSVLETALDAIVGIDHRGFITEFNPAAERIFGYRREAVIGRELAMLVIPVRLQDAHRRGLQAYLSTRTGPLLNRRIETTAIRADGREFPAEVSITAMPGDGPPRFTAFVRDVTERAEIEQERVQLLKREREVRLEAEAANRAKDQFLATLSHELRTPLNAIVGWARMLLDDTVSKQNSRRALETIERNAQIQARLVADLLDVSRIITGRLLLDMRPVDLASVIGASVDAVRPAAEAKRIAIRLGLPPGAVVARGDPARLQQVLWNLLSNAVKFTPQGGHVHVDLADLGQHVRIDVRDSGPGIPPAFLPYVFERFRQGDGSSTRQHGGLGLGLAIVRHLVELHGGTVRAESGQGSGATFSVELPRGLEEELQPVDQGTAPTSRDPQ